jgi:hypothetical protein
MFWMLPQPAWQDYMGNPEELGFRLPGRCGFDLGACHGTYCSLANRPRSSADRTCEAPCFIVQKNFEALRAFPEHHVHNSIAPFVQGAGSLRNGGFHTGERVFGIGICNLGSLTFEVTCTRQRAALDQRGIMSIARIAGPVWTAVARQVHRRVRHPSERRAG